MFKSIQEMAKCPFNKAHTFAREKFLFHINRCKDKQKVIHKFQKCQFNPTHYALKEEMEMHECCCPSRQQSISMIKKLEATFKQALRQPRQRSRERERERGEEKERKYQEKEILKHDHDEQQERTFEDCRECQEILRLYKQKIMTSKCQKLKKFIVKYYELDNEEYGS